jgi:hypothetical protein
MRDRRPESEHPDLRLERKQAYAGILFGISFMIVLFGVGILAMVFASVSWWTTQGLGVPPEVVAAADSGYVFGGGFIAFGVLGMAAGWLRSHRIQRARRLFWGR